MSNKTKVRNGAQAMRCNPCLAWRAVEALNGRTPSRTSLAPWLEGEGWVAQLNARL
jgi:maleate isomerase